MTASCSSVHPRTGLRCALREAHAGLHSAPSERERTSWLWSDASAAQPEIAAAMAGVPAERGRWFRCGRGHVWRSNACDADLREVACEARTCPSCGRSFLVAWPCEPCRTPTVRSEPSAADHPGAESEPERSSEP